MTKAINPITKNHHRFHGEAILSLVVLVAIATCQSLTWHGASKRWKITLALLAMIPMVFVFAAIVRYVLRTDEFDRKVTVESLALAGGVTALIAATYGLLEAAGFPKQSAWWTYAVFMIGWIVAKVFVLRRYK